MVSLLVDVLHCCATVHHHSGISLRGDALVAPMNTESHVILAMIIMAA